MKTPMKSGPPALETRPARKPGSIVNNSIADDDAVQSTADARDWRSAAHDLAAWAESIGIFNRRDARGGYWRDTAGDVHVTTRKSSDRRWTASDVAAIQRHFEARTIQDIIGVHAINPLDSTCRWGAIDLDDHDGSDTGKNIRCALAIRDRAEDCGLTMHLFSSDGRGGIHGWIFLNEPVESVRTFALLRNLVGGESIEIFPAQPEIQADGFGNWMRLFGRHYKRSAWSRMFGENGWLSAEATVDAILKIEPDDSKRVPPVKPVTRIVTSPIVLKHRRHFAETAESLQAWLENHGVSVKSVKPCPDGSVRLILALCPFNPDHGDGRSDTSVCVFWTTKGPRFCCQHNRCQHFKWRDLRNLIDRPRKEFVASRFSDIMAARADRAAGDINVSALPRFRGGRRRGR